jgi:RNA polymerase sigma-70 factor, ECF subfamily
MDSDRRKAIHDAMVQLSDGDRTRFDVLVDELWPVILSFAERGVGRGADAEDIAQEVFYRICARISEFDRTRDGLSWAFGIASYEIMTHRRRLGRRREILDDGSLTAQIDSSASQEEQLMAAEAAVAFKLAVGSLTADDRIHLGLRSGASEEAGPTLRKRKQRALDRLRRIWRQVYGES